ncbi:MAG: M17 family peptidase N-terminal domain-containing protein [Pseudomonadota bacterium]
MKFSLCHLSLGELDKLQCDSVSIYVFEDVKPLCGLAGIVDWRLNGMISRLLIDGSLRGTGMENFLIPVRSRLSVEKLFGFGLGRVADFSIDRVEETLYETFRTLNKASVHSTALMLPGRSENRYAFDEAGDILKRALKQDFDLDELVIADRFDDQQKALGRIVGEEGGRKR